VVPAARKPRPSDITMEQQQQQQRLQCIVQPPALTPRAQASPAAARTAPVSPRVWGSVCLPQRPVGTSEELTVAGLGAAPQATPIATRTMPRHLISFTPPPRQRQVAMATSLSFVPVHSTASSPPQVQQALPSGIMTAMRPPGLSMQAPPGSPSSQQALRPDSPPAAGAGMSATAMASATATAVSARVWAAADKGPGNFETEAMLSHPAALTTTNCTSGDEADSTAGSGGSAVTAAPAMERSSAARRVNSLNTPRRKD